VNAWIEQDNVDINSAELSTTELTGDTGKKRVIHCCANCGTALWTEYEGATACYFVRVGVMEYPSAFPPDVQIYTASKPDWLSLSSEVPIFEEYYDMKSVWPAESLKRFKRNMEKA
jgi:hypothetical protein